MREEELRTVLLVKAVEEADREGTVVHAADRKSAAREAQRRFPAAGMRSLLSARAAALLARIAARHPVVQTVLALANGPAWLAWLPLLVGLLVGFALSALDGTRRINVLAFPLFGLLAWNLFVYALLAWRLVRPRRGKPAAGWLAGALVQRGAGMSARLIARSRQFDTLIALALERFAKEWFESAKPLLLLRATSVFHCSAAAVGIGLVAGLYLRGMAFDYRAGWESTFLDAGRAHALLSLLYGPASLLTGVDIPAPAQLEALRWQAGSAGVRADGWIHLLAATAMIYVVLPRLLLALRAWSLAYFGSRNVALPDSLAAYSREAFDGVDGIVERGTVLVSPYAYNVSAAALERLRGWLPSVVGASFPVDLRAPVAYGNEDDFLRSLADRGAGVADVVVLLFSLAATPEGENHGVFIAGVRDWLAVRRPDARMKVVIDEGPYAARMGEQRLAERRESWREFVAARGLKPDFVNLAQ